MTFQDSIKVLLVSAAAACSVCPANAQEVIIEASGTVDSFHGAFGNISDLGQLVTLDFSYDSSLLALTITPTDFVLSAPMSSASIVSGIYGSGINLESNGPGSGSLSDTTSLTDGSITSIAWTSIDPPTPTFTGDVFGFSLVQTAAGNTLDLFRNVFNEGSLRDSGSVSLSNISVGPGVAQVQAPEIDASSAASALTLLVGGLAVVRGRHKPKMEAAAA